MAKPNCVRRCGGLAVIALLPLFFPVLGYTAERISEQPLERIRIVYAGLSGNQAPGWAAYEAGFSVRTGWRLNW